MASLVLGQLPLEVLAAETAPSASRVEPRVVLVTDDPDSEVATLLSAELLALGFEVTRRRPEQVTDVARELTELARAQNAVAAFRISVTSERVEVWVADRVTGKVTLREVIARKPGEQLATRTIVLRAVELLRWSLNELQAPYPPRGEVAEPPEPVRELAESASPEHRVGLSASAYGAELSGGADPGAGITLGLVLGLGAWGAQIEFAQPLVQHQLTAAAGDAEISVQWAGVGAFYSPLALRSRWQPSVGLGLRVVAFQLRGSVAQPLVGTSARDYSLAPTLSLRLGARVSDHFGAYVDGSFMFFQRTELALAGEPIGSFGPWLATAGIGMEFSTDW